MEQGNPGSLLPSVLLKTWSYPRAIKPWEFLASTRCLAPRIFAVFCTNMCLLFYTQHRPQGCWLKASFFSSSICLQSPLTFFGGVYSFQRLALMLPSPIPCCFCEHLLLSVQDGGNSFQEGIQLQALGHVIFTQQQRTNAFLDYETHLRGGFSKHTALQSHVGLNY